MLGYLRPLIQALKVKQFPLQRSLKARDNVFQAFCESPTLDIALTRWERGKGKWADEHRIPAIEVGNHLF